MTGLFITLAFGGTKLDRYLVTKKVWRQIIEGELELQNQMQANRRMPESSRIKGLTLTKQVAAAAQPSEQTRYEPRELPR